MSDKIHAYAAINKGDKLKPFEYDPGALGADHRTSSRRLCRPRARALGLDPASSGYSRLQKGRAAFLRRGHGLQSHRPE